MPVPETIASMPVKSMIVPSARRERSFVLGIDTLVERKQCWLNRY